MSQRTIIVLLGPPGAGKGTQADKLSDAFPLTHLSTGNVLREEVKKGTALGRQARINMERGELVPDHLVAEIVEQRIGAVGEQSWSVLLDGFPRNVQQAELLEAFTGLAAPWVVNIKVDEGLLVQRTSGRRHCVDCGKIYNLHFSPPRKDGVCDVCGGELIHREDDYEEVVKKRLQVYQEETQPLVDWYAAKGRCFEVDGNPDPAIVFEKIATKLQRDWLPLIHG